MDAEAHVRKRFAHKHPKYASHSLNVRSIDTLLDALPYMFQWNQSEGLNATYHFKFTGEEQREATVRIADKAIEVRDGLIGDADLRVKADGTSWLKFLAGEQHLVWALLTRRIRLKGSPTLLVKFGKCFPTSTRHKRRLFKDWREPALARSILPEFHGNDPETGRIA